MQAQFEELQAFASSVFQQTAAKGKNIYHENLVFLLTSSIVPIVPGYILKRVFRKSDKKPFHRLYPEVLEYRPPRTIAKKPLPEQTCFVHNLPDHLLLAIFEHYFHDNGETEYKTYHTNRKPTLTANFSFSANHAILFSVCKRWKSFCDTPSLWTSLAVYKPRTKQVDMITSWLQRSVPKESSETTKNKSLISLYLHDPPGDEGRDEAAINFILNLFLGSNNAGRMKHLTIKLAGDLPLSVPTFDAPYLQSVELDFGGSNDPSPIWRLICQREPRVRKVSWRPTFVKQPLLTFLMPWELLTHLKLPIYTRNHSPNVILSGLMIAFIYCENLVDLELAINLPLEHALPPITDHNAVQQAGLRRLRAVRERDSFYGNYNGLLRMEHDTLPVILEGPVDLPRLRYLKIEAHVRDATPLLDRLIVPSLRSLEIIHCASGPLQSSTDGIVSLLQRSRPPLTTLSLFDPHMTKAETLKLLSLPLTELRDLELYVGPVGNNIMRALTITPETHPIPNLRKLVLPECAVSNGHMARMVTSRIQHSTLKVLRMSLPPVIKTKPRMRTMSKEQYDELRLLKDLASNLSKERFVLIVD